MNAALPTTAIAGPWDIPIGAPVVDRAGESLGRVVEADTSDLHVRRGWFFMPTVAIPLGHVARYDDGILWLDISREELARRS
jgi:hypothetical protein